jgi:hypothetical protein
VPGRVEGPAFLLADLNGFRAKPKAAISIPEIAAFLTDH